MRACLFEHQNSSEMVSDVRFGWVRFCIQIRFFPEMLSTPENQNNLILLKFFCQTNFPTSFVNLSRETWRKVATIRNNPSYRAFLSNSSFCSIFPLASFSALSFFQLLFLHHFTTKSSLVATLFRILWTPAVSSSFPSPIGNLISLIHLDAHIHAHTHSIQGGVNAFQSAKSLSICQSASKIISIIRRCVFVLRLAIKMTTTPEHCAPPS